MSCVWPDEERRVQGSPTAICFARVTFIFRSMKKKEHFFCAEEVYHGDETQQQKGVEGFYLFIYLFLPLLRVK